MFCSKCGIKNMDGARFCQKCGNVISNKPDAISAIKKVHDATGTQKAGAFLFGWLVSGLFWSVGANLSKQLLISTDSFLGITLELFGIVFVIVVWIKVYLYFIDKWTKK